MEINVTPIRGGILALLLVAFYLTGGFEMPDQAVELRGRRFAKAWYLCIVIFALGAVKVSIMDHWVGNVERSNIRICYIVLGVILMLVALVWQSMLRG